MTDDQALVSRIIDGDKQAFRLLIKQNERLVAHMVGRLIDRNEDREELCQDVFLRVYEKISEFNFQSKLSTWIATIAYRMGVNHLRAPLKTHNCCIFFERWIHLKIKKAIFEIWEIKTSADFLMSSFG